jgi:hypothetical protein
MSSGERESTRVMGSSDVSEGRVAPTGRDARLWRVLVELSLSVGESRHDATESTAMPRSKPLAPGQLERLVVEFDDAYTIFVEGMERLPSESQLVALQAVDRQLTSMVRAQEVELWTQKALREDGRWLEVQRLSVGAIEVFAWPSQRLALVVPGALSDGLGSGRSSENSDEPRRSS